MACPTSPKVATAKLLVSRPYQTSLAASAGTTGDMAMNTTNTCRSTRALKLAAAAPQWLVHPGGNMAATCKKDNANNAAAGACAVESAGRRDRLVVIKRPLCCDAAEYLVLLLIVGMSPPAKITIKSFAAFGSEPRRAGRALAAQRRSKL